jgi:uncharacterized protein Yka (UPF0111/DUF47 family)
VFAGGKTDGFQEALERQCAVTAELTGLLETYVHTTNASDQAHLAEAAGEVEHAGDRVRAELLERLQQTFVTPFDREDLNDLSQAIDDIADYAENAIKEMRLYQVRPNPYLEAMAHTLAEATAALTQAVTNLKTDRAASAAAARLAKSKENHMEGIYRLAIAHLGEEEDIHYLIKLREVYRHFSNAADRVDTAANVITRILVKEGG